MSLFFLLHALHIIIYVPYIIYSMRSFNCLFNHVMGQWKFSGDKHKSLQVDTERTFHQRYPLVML